MQLLHIVDKSEKFIDEYVHTDIRMKAAAINDPAVDFGARSLACRHVCVRSDTLPCRLSVFERFLPVLVEKGIEHRLNVLRCSQSARTVGDVIVQNAGRIKAALVVMAKGEKSRLAAALLGSSCSHVMSRSPVPVLIVRSAKE